mgnify:CR=1 FL=1
MPEEIVVVIDGEELGYGDIQIKEDIYEEQ